MSVISKTSGAKRVMHLDLKALKEHEELQQRLEKLEREAKQLEREAKEKEIPYLQEEVARRAKIAENEIEMAEVSSSCGLVSEVSHQSRLQTTICRKSQIGWTRPKELKTWHRRLTCHLYTSKRPSQH